MRKLLSVVLLVVVLAMPASAAFADSPPTKAEKLGPQQPYVLLGDQVEFAFFLVDLFLNPLPFYPIDIYLWRPPTTFAGFPVWPLDGTWAWDYNGWITPLPTVPMTAVNWWGTGPTWFWEGGESEFRRQSWPAFQETDVFGFYYAKFMLPRDEVWFPCGYPCRWGCNDFNPITGYEWHSPWLWIDLYPNPLLRPVDPAWPILFPLYWPWLWDYIAGDWMFNTMGFLDWEIDLGDTIHPLTGWAIDPIFDAPVAVWGYEVDGYWWKTSDLEMEWPEDWPWLCPEDLLP